MCGVIKAVGFTKKHVDGLWDATLVWKYGCVESWGHPSRKVAKMVSSRQGKRLGLDVDPKWRKA